MVTETLQELFTRTLDKVLQFRMGVKIFEYIDEKHRRDWREFEEELNVEYPVRGDVVRFSKELFKNWTAVNDNHSFVFEDRMIAAYDITDAHALQAFAYQEMAIVYLFSMLEDFGNVLSVKMGYDLGDRAWHSGVNRYKDIVERRLAFAKVFNKEASDILEKMVELLFDIKEVRNQIVHDHQYPDKRNFHSHLRSLVVLFCYLYHLCDASKSPMEYKVSYFQTLNSDEDFFENNDDFGRI
ncbi:MAG: hypothetical protein HYU70_00560 [Bacteroidetes bacterium]|nr:hypothetical protein [Bacteroidota bacterium]